MKKILLIVGVVILSSIGFADAKTDYTNAESLKRDKHFNLEHIIKISKILNIDIQELFKE